MLKYSIQKRILREFSQNAKQINKKVGSMEWSLDYYKNLRIYKDKTTVELMNAKMVWNLCKLDKIVDNGELLYNFSSKIIGTSITNYLLANTMGQQFTAGSDTESLRNTVLKLNSLGLGVMIDYLAELKPGVEIPESEFDWNYQKIELAIRECHVSSNNSFALKLSALCNLDSLKKASKIQNKIDRLFNPDSSNKKKTITYDQLKSNMDDQGIVYSEEEFQSFVDLIKMDQCNEMRHFSHNEDMLSIVEWRVKLACLNIYNPCMDTHPIYQQIAKYSPKETQEVKNCKKRLFSIFKIAFDRKLYIAIDAEQTYIQDAIRGVAEQCQIVHNKAGNSILNTYQAYLKSSKWEIEVECLKSQILEIPLCVKLVRGAYLVEESKLADEYNYSNPIHDTVENTHNCYDQCAEAITKSVKSHDKIIIATHNKESCLTMMEKLKNSDNSKENLKNVIFAQLLGLGDNLSFALLSEDFSILKYVPFGEKEIMLPYLLRRGQESKQMLSSVDLQIQLLNHEFMKRAGLKR